MSNIEKRIANCLLASRRTVDEKFSEYWISVAKVLADSYDVDIAKIDKNPEIFLRSVDTVH